MLPGCMLQFAIDGVTTAAFEPEGCLADAAIASRMP
jgi:hypothetical protein